MKELSGYINCRTQEEREMVLDIFEMLGYKWNEGQSPRGYTSYSAPMYYDVCGCKIRQGSSQRQAGTEARDLRNMWISLKRRNKDEVR